MIEKITGFFLAASWIAVVLLLTGLAISGAFASTANAQSVFNIPYGIKCYAGVLPRAVEANLAKEYGEVPTAVAVASVGPRSSNQTFPAEVVIYANPDTGTSTVLWYLKINGTPMACYVFAATDYKTVDAPQGSSY